MPKLQTFYGIWTTDDEMHGSYKAYAQTRELAEEELKNHHDFYCSTSPTPDNKHIVPMNMIVADNSDESVNTQKDIEFRLECIADRTYLIVTEDQFENDCYKEFPMIVHGILRVDGRCVERASVGFIHVSDEAFKQLDSLMEKAKNRFFKIN